MPNHWDHEQETIPHRIGPPVMKKGYTGFTGRPVKLSPHFVWFEVEHARKQGPKVFPCARTKLPAAQQKALMKIEADAENGDEKKDESTSP
jgi:hypothetical protein